MPIHQIPSFTELYEICLPYVRNPMNEGAARIARCVLGKDPNIYSSKQSSWPQRIADGLLGASLCLPLIGSIASIVFLKIFKIAPIAEPLTPLAPPALHLPDRRSPPPSTTEKGGSPFSRSPPSSEEARLSANGSASPASPLSAPARSPSPPPAACYQDGANGSASPASPLSAPARSPSPPPPAACYRDEVYSFGSKSQQICTFHTEQRGDTWIVSSTSRLEGKEEPVKQTKTEYHSQTGETLRYFAWEQASGTLEVIYTPETRQLSVTITPEQGKLQRITHTLPPKMSWIQQPTIGHRPFILTEKRESLFIFIDPRDGSMVHSHIQRGSKPKTVEWSIKKAWVWFPIATLTHDEEGWLTAFDFSLVGVYSVKSSLTDRATWPQGLPALHLDEIKPLV